MIRAPAAVSALSLALFIAGAASAKPAAPRELLGAWRAEKIERKGRVEPFPRGIELRVEFYRKGRFVSVLRDDRGKRRREGSFELVNRRRLVTRLAGRTEELAFRIDGESLILSNVKTGERLYLLRAR